MGTVGVLKLLTVSVLPVMFSTGTGEHSDMYMYMFVRVSPLHRVFNFHR